jgi:hypothetical protein
MRALFVCLCALSLLEGPAHAKTKLAVLGIEAVDEGDVSSQEKTAAAARSFTEALRGRVNLLASKYSIPPKSFKELTEVKILSNCLDESTACMSQVGKELDAEKVLFGKLEKEKGGYTLTVRMLNVATKSYERSPKSVGITAADAGNESAVKEKAAQVFAELTGMELTGSLTVKANVEAGQVYVGGEPKRALSGGVATIGDLPEGSLLVSVEAKGYKTSEQQVTITSGKEAHVDFTLEPDGSDVVVPPPGGGEPGRPLNKWKIIGWSGIAVGVGLGIFAAYAHWGVEEKLQQDVHDRAQANGHSGDACTYAPNQSDCDKGEKYAKYATVAGPAAGVIGAAGLAILIFKGYGGGETGGGIEATAASRRFVVTPTVSPDSAGASVLFRF